MVHSITTNGPHFSVRDTVNIVNMDVCFSNPDLYSELYSKQTDAVGILHQNRECLTK